MNLQRRHFIMACAAAVAAPIVAKTAPPLVEAWSVSNLPLK
jgi:hypothetical protein